MKLILSRKGFDGGNGRCPSPIFPDETMVSLPILLGGASHKMSQVPCGQPGVNIGQVVADITARLAPANRLSGDSSVHLDPSLKPHLQPVPPGWRSAFGQVGTAQGHLTNRGIAKGDLFLFFGWFRKVEQHAGRWRYRPESPDLHVVFGWLEVDQILQIDDGFNVNRAHPWLSDHPHVRHAKEMGRSNTVYVASQELTFDKSKAGGGSFDRFKPRLQLTTPNANQRSMWTLPSWFHPSAPPTMHDLSYHETPGRWTLDGNGLQTQLRAVNRGQEFVISLDGDRRHPAMEWLKSLF